jgi:outer membrane protein TolC
MATAALALLAACRSVSDDERVAAIPLRASPAIAAWAAHESSVPASDDLLADAAQLVRFVADRNAEVAAGVARVRQMEAALDQARLWPDPSLDLGVDGVVVGSTNPPDLPRRDAQNYSAGLHEKVEVGKRGPRAEAARLRAEAERLRLADLLARKARQVREALGRELYLRAKTEVTRENLDAARQMLALEHRRLEQGDMSGNEYDRLALDTTVLELDLPRTEAEHAAALADLRALLAGSALRRTRGSTLSRAPRPCPRSRTSSRRSRGARITPRSPWRWTPRNRTRCSRAIASCPIRFSESGTRTID